MVDLALQVGHCAGISFVLHRQEHVGHSSRSSRFHDSSKRMRMPPIAKNPTEKPVANDGQSIKP
jgi:hypothetical protein